MLLIAVFNAGMDQIERDRERIKELGGPAKVAELLGLEKAGGVQRVQNWTTRGIPPAVKVAHPALFMPEFTKSPDSAPAPLN